MASDEDIEQNIFDYIVVGGGIAGVTCVETLLNIEPLSRIALVSSSPVIKTVNNLHSITRILEDFQVVECPIEEYASSIRGVRVIRGTMSHLNAGEHSILVTNVAGMTKESSSFLLKYRRICLTTGGTPRNIAPDEPLVLTLRDSESAQELKKRLATARRIMLIGNGGIATELSFEIQNCHLVWVIKDESISASFFDAGAAQFLQPSLQTNMQPKPEVTSHLQYTSNAEIKDANLLPPGAALGPDWHQYLLMSGTTQRRVDIVRQAQVENLWRTSSAPPSIVSCMKCIISKEIEEDSNWPLLVQLSNEDVWGCDLVISATGVQPNVAPMSGQGFQLAEDGGLCIDEQMNTSIPHVFAAGDVATANWMRAPHWFQMRLWLQARQMGFRAARCMQACLRSADPPPMDFCFELFTHVTRFFGFKVILLGLFNAQGLDVSNYDLLLRVTPGVELVKCVMQNGRMQGALLVGDTDLEETFENLILNQMDLTQFGDSLLEPGIDIDDFFD